MAEPEYTNAEGGEAKKLEVKSEGENTSQFVTKDELFQFQNSILDAIERKMSPASPGATMTDTTRDRAVGVVGQAVSDAQALVEAASADRSNGYMPPQYQRIFDKYFDGADGFECRLVFPEVDESGRESGGIMFTIIVPMKFSNAHEAYKTFYKNDIRSRALKPDGISKGIDDWCRRVAKNLGYNKMIKTK